ncbi:Na+/H+ antiporter NhaC family protein [Aneurinibacillus sp. Ricciae_BoGa-3]|uniref:Na+/H+ antiporter NhaC family protein n=1 Tax=Aneurinibacillus sp. Ricciae_BoGa-3 TaxID=3022697 RepID=UPI0023405E9D|nr:Na+/H+ antiporter NhaC family protein [Aneurinibacillus sp. Ricciae_BoGa-3]WCK54430.1 Na+/H+ antiporter NhaC family protein [Aneurinibacillus sp. Ricciae_BoGa-3]
MGGSWVSLLPFLIVIPISVLTKQVQPGLFVALLLGSYLKDPTFLGGIRTMLAYMVNNIVKPSNIRIIIFLYTFAGLISIIKLAGGIKGFVHLVSKKVKSKRSAMLLTWISTMFTFSDPDFRIVTIAPIMKALKDRLKMSSQKIGFVIEVTSNPVVGLIPLATAFVGYMVSVIAMALRENGIHDKPYTVYVKSIPFNFFSFVMIALGLFYTFFKKDADIIKTENENPNAEQGEEGLQSCYRAYEKETPIKPWNLLLPLLFVLCATLFLSWWDGRRQATGFFDAFLHSDALGVMLEALFLTLILTLIYFLFQKIPVSKLVTHFVKGGNELMSVIIMLALIWGVSAVAEDLGFSRYITSHVKGWIPHFFVAPVLFLLGGLISYFIGSSWGTWGLLMPLGVTLAHQAGANILLVIGAVFASGTFGAFASPLSDNTVTLCTILDLPVIAYARTKLIPALIAAGITTVLFGIASFFLR